METSPVWLFPADNFPQSEERIPVWIYDGSIVLPTIREVSLENPAAVSWQPEIGHETFPKVVRWTHRKSDECFPLACLEGDEHDFDEAPDFDELGQPVGTSFICSVCGCSGD